MNKGHFVSCSTPLNCWCEPKKYGWVILVVLITFFIQAIGAWVSSSLALGSDTLHLALDNVALFISFTVAITVKLSPSLEATSRLRGAKVNVWVLRVVATCILLGAWFRFYYPPEQIRAFVMTPIAILGLFGNFMQHEALHVEKYSGKKLVEIISGFFNEMKKFVRLYPATLKYMVYTIGYGERDHTHELQHMHILWDLTFSMIVIVVGIIIALTGLVVFDTIGSMIIAGFMFFSTSKIMSRLNHEHHH